MKNFNNRKSIVEQGGLMIEALAMLGLIAVVTPTMYKKSAERTMEVEDINTSTTIRTLMNAAESYVAANYIKLLNDPELKLPEDQTQEQMAQKEITIVDDPTTDNVNENELAPYLPYKYETKGALYNYGTPKMTVVRSGDSISAFMLFPAKGSEDEGIGQERTVRIASLIGSNGGYVSEKGKQAHGVGGVWSLDDTHYSKIFPSDNSEKYSIVTSSTNVSNSSTAGAEPDMTKYLQRTREHNAGEGKELWRNAMRTDLYMGLVNAADDKWQKKTEFFSIQNVNKMIIGAHDKANGYTEAAGLLADYTGIDGTSVLDTNGKLRDNYGLFIFGSGDTGEQKNADKTYGNAFINGSIEALRTAANKTLFNVYYLEGNITKDSHLTFDGTNFELGKASDDMYAIKGNVASGEKQVNVFDSTVAIDAKTDGSRTINILGDDSAGNTNRNIQIDENKGVGNYKKGSNSTSMVAINTQDTAYTGVSAPQYSNKDAQPDFGVDVNGNMVVEGVLAAGQIDTNRVRASNLSVGSANIDAADKWMDVDNQGVRIHDPASKYETSKKAKRELIADEKAVALRVGGTAKTVNDNSQLNGMDAELVLDEEGIVVKAGEGKKAIVASDQIGVNIQGNIMKFGNTTDQGDRDTTKDQYLAEFGEGGNVDIKEGNFKVSNASNPVFVVRGNDSITGIADAATGTDSASDYQIAGHGNTLFSDGTDNTRYLGMGFDDKTTAVNIVSGGEGHGGATNRASTRVLFVDLDDRNYASYIGEPGETTNYKTKGKTVGATSHQERELQEGSIYIRKGLIDVAPDRAQVDVAANVGVAKEFSADEGRGVVRASRFVANNVTKDGKRVMVPDMFKGNFINSAGVDSQKKVYDVFNGTEGAIRYDTYMVNPAYTSVMNDIKLVSRSGARLSDILPDFITKAIYTANNTWTEDMFTNMSGKDPSKYKLKCTGHSCDIEGRKDNVTGDPLSKPASPIIGLVPVPQCPPGYQKVIQVTPASISMAQAGQLVEAEFPTVVRNSHDKSIDVKDMFEIATDPNNTYSSLSDTRHANDSNQKSKISHLAKVKSAFDHVTSKVPTENEANPTYEKRFQMGGFECKETTGPNGTGDCLEYKKQFTGLKIELPEFDDQGNVAIEKTVDAFGNETGNTAENRARYSGANRKEIEIRYKDKYYIGMGAPHEDQRTAYIDEDANKILKLNNMTLAGKVEDFTLRNHGGSERYVLTSTGDALEPLVFQKNTRMYTQAVPLDDRRDVDGVGTPYTRAWELLMGFIYKAAPYQQMLQNTEQLMQMPENNLVWNIFPVQATSLEAFVTTYCYWDSANRLGDVTNDQYQTTGELPGIEVESYYADSFKPTDKNLEYRKKLNDPSMKYNELW